MIQLSRLFENQLDDPEVSGEELRQFAEDFLGKTKGLSEVEGEPNAAAYARIATALRGAFDPFDAALSARGVMLAGLSGETITKDDAVRLLRTTVRQREGRVRDKLGERSAGYAQFFPRGLTEYSTATLPKIPGLLDRLIEASRDHQAELGPELLAEFEGLKVTFSEAREGQVEQKGDVSGARRAVAETRRALERAVGLALLELAQLHFGEPERAKDFFDQSLLEDPTRSRNDEVTGTPTPA